MAGRISRPIIVLGAPRSGTTILQRCLALHPDLWHLPGESHALLEGPLHPQRNGYESNRETGDDLTAPQLQALRDGFYEGALNLNRVLAQPARYLAANTLAERIRDRIAVRVMGARSKRSKPDVIRLLEKTPKNSLRVPLLDTLFPDALFLWNKRAAAPNVDSLIAGWHTVDRIGPWSRPRFGLSGYPVAGELGLTDYPHARWKFALPPGWRGLKGKTVADVAAWQWYQCNRTTQDDLARLDPSRVLALRYEDFVARPVEGVRQVLAWAGLDPSPEAEAYAATGKRVNESSPGAKRDGLRHAEPVARALAALPEVEPLLRAMGYEAGAPS